MSLEHYHVIPLLQQQSRTLKEATALQGFEMQAPWHQVSWQAFDRISTQIAKVLLHLQVKVQDRCVILAKNCPQWTCADVGILKARAVVVPIYPTSTVAQARFIVDDANAKVIFVDDAKQYAMACELQEQCPSLKHIVVFDNAVELLAGAQAHQHLDMWLACRLNQEAELDLRLRAANLDDLLTLIYTSGTTGEPKGVMLDYRNMAAMICQHDQIVSFDSGDVSLAFLPLSHVFERSWSFYALCRGGTNVYVSDPQQVQTAIAAVRPHTLCVVPRFLEKVYSAIQAKVAKAPSGRKKLFAWAISVGQRRFEVLQGRMQAGVLLSLQWRLANKLVYSKLKAALGGRLKFIPCGGAALDTTVGDFFHGIDLPILCGYGMTETSATVSCNTLNNRVPGSSGKALPETDIKLGKDNEILVRGATVMRGYYNRPEDTAATFEDGWLKTGDAGRIDENGNLFITERIKELMKTSNGKYIAPQRIEGMIGCSPLVEQVAIVADARNYVTALIVPAFAALEAWAKQQGLKYESSISLVRHSQVVEHFEQRLKELQQELASFEQIKKFTLLPDAFSMEAGLITPTLKLKRKMIYHKYAREIDAMYHS